MGILMGTALGTLPFPLRIALMLYSLLTKTNQICKNPSNYPGLGFKCKGMIYIFCTGISGIQTIYWSSNLHIMHVSLDRPWLEQDWITSMLPT